MWLPNQHPDGENLTWAHLRAIEWRIWPLFLSQPVIPIFLYLYPWHWVVIALALVSFCWWIAVVPWSTPGAGIDNATYFVFSKFVSAPLMAYLTWQQGAQWIALAVLFSPLLITSVVGYVLVIPQTILCTIFPGLKATEIGAVQRRLMDSLGYDRDEVIGYVRREPA